MRCVEPTSEFFRIKRLPWEPWDEDPNLGEIQRRLTRHLRKPHGRQELFPMQAAVLACMAQYGSCVLAGLPGSGKTLPGMLAATLLGAKRTVFLVPALDEEETRKKYATYRLHWRLGYLHIITYQQIATPGSRDLLLTLQPDLIVCDEFHKLKNPSAIVTKRVYEAIKAFKPRQLFMSGSPLNRSLREIAPALISALGDRAPVPRNKYELAIWHSAISEKVRSPAEPGALLQLCKPGQDHVEKFGHRLLATPGVIGTRQTFSGSLTIRAYHLDMQPDTQALLKQMHRDNATPCGWPIGTPLEKWRHDRELSCGFYQRWKKIPPPRWLEGKKMWCALTREVAQTDPALDSQVLIAAAIDRGEIDDLGVLEEWREVRPIYEPEMLAVWVDDTMVRHAVKWIKKHPHGIVWVEHVEVGARIAKLSGVPFFRTGREAANWRGLNMIVSIRAGSESLNLQSNFKSNLIVSTPTTNLAYEQLIARTHRLGQTSNVLVDVPLRFDGDYEGLLQACRDSTFVFKASQQKQRLIEAKWEIDTKVSKTRLRLWAEKNCRLVRTFSTI